MNDKYIKPLPENDYYITYHLLLRAIAILEKSVYLLTSEEDIASDIQIDQELFKCVFEVKLCIESIKFKHDVLRHPVNNE